MSFTQNHFSLNLRKIMETTREFTIQVTFLKDFIFREIDKMFPNQNLIANNAAAAAAAANGSGNLNINNQ